MSKSVRSRNRDKNANGSVRGSAIMIVIGWTRLSNCAASTMYMNRKLRKNAIRKFVFDSASSLARPMNSWL